MRTALTLVAALLLSGLPAGASGLARADSLALCGRTGEARDLLLDQLQPGRAGSEAVLYRLVGLYHGSGLEDEGLRLLDSLEEATGVRMTGWKVSLLDLAGRREEAVVEAGTGDVLLLLFLLDFETGALPAGTVLPVPEGAFERYVRFMSAPGGSLRPDQIKAGTADAAMFPALAERLCIELEGDCREAGPWWDSALDSLEVSAPGPRTALLRLRRMEYTRSLDQEYAGWCIDSMPEVAAEAARLLVKLAPDQWSGSWRVADALAAGGCLRELESMISASRDSVFRRGARLALLRSRERYGDLLAAASDSSSPFPDSLAARAALFRARALRDLGRSSEAWIAYVDFARRYPWHPQAADAAYLAARAYDSDLEWGRAAEAYVLSLACPGERSTDETCYWRGGFGRYLCGMTSGADSLWTAGCAEWPFGWWHDEMMYWLARCVSGEDPGRSNDLVEELIELHPWEYYGLRAAQRAGAFTPGRPRQPSIDLLSVESCSLAVTLVARGAGVLAVELLGSGGLPCEDSRAAALSLLGEHRDALMSLMAWEGRLRESGEGMLPDSMMPFCFPAPYAGLVFQASDSILVDPGLLLGIIREESSFDHLATSSAGAKGLIQLMPGTASDVARWNDLPRLSGDDFYDPWNSLRYGSLYIDRQFRNYGGELPLLLAAYNAGPGNASRWRDTFGYSASDPEMFIEQITFRETRNYVKKVTRSAWVYRRLFQ